MITSVDTNILLDIFIPDHRHGQQSKERLTFAYDAGTVIISDVVYAELVAFFGDQGLLDGALLEINVTNSPIDKVIAYEAGLRWMRYRQAGGSRTRIITDFLIGAHALTVADAFLSRDTGFYRTYFPELDLTPSP